MRYGRRRESTTRAHSAVLSRSSQVAVLAVLFLLLHPALADSQRLSLGGRVGVGLGLGVFEDDEANGHVGLNVGPQLGGLAAYRLGSVLSIQVELSYTQKGWIEGEHGGGRKLTYLELPLLFVVNTPWRVVPHLLIGPAVSYELGCRVSGIPEVGSVGCSDDRVEWHRKKTLFGIQAGFGWGKRLGDSILDFQVLGDLSLTNLNRETLPRGFTKLLVLTLSAAYKFPLRG